MARPISSQCDGGFTHGAAPVLTRLRVVFSLPLHRGGTLGVFLFREQRARSKLDGTFERNRDECTARPYSLKVRISPGCTRHTLGAEEHRRREHDGGGKRVSHCWRLSRRCAAPCRFHVRPDTIGGSCPAEICGLILGGRSTVGHGALDAVIGVRIPASQPTNLFYGFNFRFARKPSPQCLHASPASDASPEAESTTPEHPGSSACSRWVIDISWCPASS